MSSIFYNPNSQICDCADITCSTLITSVCGNRKRTYGE
jgi:hypothetical protein